MSSLSLKDLRSMLAIDRYNLDRDCTTQPALFEEAAQITAELKIKARAAKSNYEVVRAKRSLAIREKMQKGSGKVTEGIISSNVDCDPFVVEAREQQHDAERAALRAEAVMVGFDHRRSMLNNVVELLKAGFTSVDGFIPNTREQETLERGIADVRTKKKSHRERAGRKGRAE